jgi:transposase
MLVFREVLRLHFELGKSYATIAEICGLSKGGVHNIIQRFGTSGLAWPLPEELDEYALKRRLYQTAERFPEEVPDPDYLRTECARPGVTLQLLWEEYRVVHPDGVSRSAFYRHCQQMERSKPVMKNDYQGGEYLLVDYSGKRLAYLDRDAGARVPVEIFVASWGASSGAYVEATRTQGARDFVYAHVNAFAYFGCVPHLVTPDNLKSAVTKPDRADPVLCQLYRKFAEHYDVVIAPARVAKPRDKATAESAVRCVQQRILAPLREQQFFSLAEVNAAIVPYLDALNDRPMREYQGQSRRERFLRYDLPAAKPLPAERFQVTDARYALRVPANYLVTYDHHYYSVPYALIDHHVDLFLTGDVLEIYHHGTHVARHAKQPSDGRQSIIDAHQPEQHRRVRGRSKDYYLHVAECIGPFTVVLIEEMYARKKHDELAHRSAQGVISLCKYYDSARVEAAAERAVYYRRSTLRDLKQILTQGLEQQPLPGAGQRQLPMVTHTNLRGAAYYQGE